MQVLHHPGDARALRQGCVATIGAYDGVHLGHRAVIAQVRERAQRLAVASAVVTFDRHPASVVRPDSAPALLTDLPQKLDLLAATGVDYTVLVHFDEQRARESAEDFVTTILVELLAVRAVIVGADFHFGHRRSGNVALLAAMGAELGFEVTGVDLVGDGGMGAGDRAGSAVPVSSTSIRQLLAAGDVVAAGALLGRPHQVRGIVAHGDQRGRQLGYPTANVAVPAEIAMPADGVYAGWYCRPDGVARPAALSLGRRPTFYEHADLSLLEAFLLDFDDDLYDEEAHVGFVASLRSQQRFDSVDDLVAQMGRDVAEIRARLAAVTQADSGR